MIEIDRDETYLVEMDSSDDGIEIIVNDDLLVVIKRTDCGYVIDHWKNRGGLISTSTIWDDDLEDDENE